MKRIGIVLLMLLCIIDLNAKSSSTAAQNNTFLVLKPNATTSDNTANVINLDSTKIAYMNQFLGDSLRYYQRDSLLQAKIDSLNSIIIDIQRKAENGKYIYTAKWVRCMLISVVSVLTIFLLYFRIIRKDLFQDVDRMNEDVSKLKDDADKMKGYINKMKEKEHRIDNNNQLNKQLEAKQIKNNMSSNSYQEVDKEMIEKLQNEIGALNNRVELLERASLNNNIKAENGGMETSQQTESEQILYADSIIDGVFSHVRERDNDDTVFVLKLKNETNASFTVYRRAYNKVLANPSFLDGCDKQMMNNNTVVILSEGEAEKRANGKWKVVSPLRVEI